MQRQVLLAFRGALHASPHTCPTLNKEARLMGSLPRA